MKTNPSRIVLAAEIFTIILFHTVKINQSEKHTADTAFTPLQKHISLPKQRMENKSVVQYMLVNLVK